MIKIYQNNRWIQGGEKSIFISALIFNEPNGRKRWKESEKQAAGGGGGRGKRKQK